MEKNTQLLNFLIKMFIHKKVVFVSILPSDELEYQRENSDEFPIISYKTVSFESLKRELLKNGFLLYRTYAYARYSYGFIRKDVISINMKSSSFERNGKFWLRFNKNYGYGTYVDLDEEKQEHPEIIPFIKYLKEKHSDQLAALLSRKYTSTKKLIDKIKDDLYESEKELNQINNMANMLPEKEQLKFELLKDK